MTVEFLIYALCIFSVASALFCLGHFSGKRAEYRRLRRHLPCCMSCGLPAPHMSCTLCGAHLCAPTISACAFDHDEQCPHREQRLKTLADRIRQRDEWLAGGGKL